MKTVALNILTFFKNLLSKFHHYLSDTAALFFIIDFTLLMSHTESFTHHHSLLLVNLNG